MKTFIASFARRGAAAIAGALVTYGVIATESASSATEGLAIVLSGAAAYAVSWIGSRVFKKKPL